MEQKTCRLFEIIGLLESANELLSGSKSLQKLAHQQEFQQTLISVLNYRGIDGVPQFDPESEAKSLD